MKKPILIPVPLPKEIGTPGQCFITFSPGQWDGILAAAYERGWMLLLIKDEVAVKAFQKPKPSGEN